MTVTSKLDALLSRSDTFSVSFHTSILPGQLRCATFMSKGRGDWIKGYGDTADAAFDDMVRQSDGGVAVTTRPVTVETPTTPNIITRMPI